jgi:hypothetical protein
MKTNFRHKLPAFTIIELVVSLMISGIVIGIIYYSFLFFERQFQLYNDRSEKSENIILFKNAINHDFEASALAIDSANEIMFYSDFSKMSETYDIFDKYIVRTNNLEKDTFLFEAKIHTIDHHPINNKAITTIDFEIKIGSDYIDCVFEKEYSAKELMSYQMKNDE